jgi:hypothetical protein
MLPTTLFNQFQKLTGNKINTPRVIILALAVPLLLLPLIVAFASDMHTEEAAVLYFLYLLLVLIYEWYLFKDTVSENGIQLPKIDMVKRLVRRLLKGIGTLVALFVIASICGYFWVNQKVDATKITIEQSDLQGDLREGTVRYYYANVKNNSDKKIRELIIGVEVLDTNRMEIVGSFNHSKRFYSPMLPGESVSIERYDAEKLILKNLPYGIAYTDSVKTAEVYTALGSFFDL